MDADFREQLQQVLGTAYTVERELGGGGMSRVFVATDNTLGRKVVVKTLPPELAAGVNIDRFRREIQLAAQLQHPHIVPVLSAGAAEGIPYYTMPLIEGESLRARLARAGELAIPDAIRFLREVVSALAYAHARGVVHRDIKPDNVLLSGEYALVADFGVAKAISASAGGANSLTSLGVALGTPAYMAPEQAAADPNVDARADLYAVGAMAYEMLTGSPPFAGRSPQATLVAHLGEAPAPLIARRPNVPPTLAALVMRLLEKRPADRPQSADDVLHALDALVTPISGTAPAIAAAQRPVRTVGTARALGLYAGASVLAVLVAWAASRIIGLPLWVVPGTAFVMALGLPVILFSVLAHRVPVPVPASSGEPAPTAMRLAAAMRPWLTWRRVTMGGVASMALFAIFVAGFMLLRGLGIGPSASLLAAGVLSNRGKVLITDFRAPAADSSLGRVVSDALRTDLEESPVVTVVEPAAVRDALRRMQQPATARVDLALAREIAAREGIKAVVDGDIAAVGSGFMVSARLVSAPTGQVLAAYRAGARDANALIPAIDQLSKQLRAKIGESLRSVNAAPPLAQVTTSSLDALRKYSEGMRAITAERDFPKGEALLNEAIALDSTFAMAYRKLGVEYNNSGTQPARAYAMLKKAFDLRDRLSPIEKHLAAAAFYEVGPDPEKAVPEYDAVLALDPDNSFALNNLGSFYALASRDLPRARVLLEHALAPYPDFTYAAQNLAQVEFQLADTAAAFATMRALQRHRPRVPDVYDEFFQLYEATGRYDSALRAARFLRDSLGSNPIARLFGNNHEAELAQIHGRLREASASLDDAAAADAELGNAMALVDASVARALSTAVVAGRTDDAARQLDELAKRIDFSKVTPLERRYLARARVYAAAGRPDRARALVAEFEGSVPVEMRGFRYWGDLTAGYIALAERRPDSAVAHFRKANRASCSLCALPELARSYDAAGQADSAIALYERFLTTPMDIFRSQLDALWLAPTYKRLGELYDARGDTERALSYYGKFIALWKDADPELQPQVQQARKRMAQLSARKG